MFKRIAIAFMLLGVSCLLPLTARAQTSDPAAQAFGELVGYGYDVVEVGYFPDAQGKPSTNSVYALSETISTDFNNRYLTIEALRTFAVLSKYFPSAEYYVAALRYDRWIYFFVTTASDWDDLTSDRIGGEAFWNQVTSQARIYDSVNKKYVTPQDFTSQNQTDKNQTNKDFSGQPNSPLPPVNANPNAQAENILLEPSTTYLPADGKSTGLVMATLTDREFAGLPGRGVNFTFEVRGQDDKPLGSLQTDRFGTARAQITSSRPLDLVLLRANTANLNATTQILVGDPPGDNVKAQARALQEGLESQNYTDVEADYAAQTAPNGKEYRIGIAAVRVTSKYFDRAVYSQLARMLGTIRTVMPQANLLRPVLEYAAPDGHDYALLFNMNTDVWDAFVRGDIGENQLWENLAYAGAVNENGVRTDSKDFLNKNFSGSAQTRYSSVTRRVTSSLTMEAWGEQLTVGSFLVPVGGSADTFTVAEMTGQATGLAIYATPDYNTPVFKYNPNDAAALASLRLASGQYVVEVTAPSAPAAVTLDYVEHIAH